MDCSIQVAGERLALLPERAVHWAREGTIFISDVHVGKNEHFRKTTPSLAGAGAQSDFQRLSAIVARTAARRVIILGDLIHAWGPFNRASYETIGSWRAQNSNLEILLVRGNHDRVVGDPPTSWRLQVVNPGFLLHPFVLHHEPSAVAPVTPGASPYIPYALCGHLHPGTRLAKDGNERGVVLPCFWFRARTGILPSFGSSAGNSAIRVGTRDRVYVIDNGAVTVASPQ